MSDEITESAKAVQEIAKTTGQAITTVEKIGVFFSRIMKESIDSTCGMLADTLKFKRWERQVSLIDKAEKIIERKQLSERMRPIQPKLALPIFQYASLEEDESLHDIWANLLVSALDPSCAIPRSAFIDIIRQLEPIDVKILNLLYMNYMKKYKVEIEHEEKSIEESIELIHRTREEAKEFIIDKNNDYSDTEKRLQQTLINVYRNLDTDQKIKDYVDEKRKEAKEKHSPSTFTLSQSDFMNELNIDFNTFCTSIDNLIRERLVSSYVESHLIPEEPDDWKDGNKFTEVSFDHGYSEVCITTLGVSFVKACTVVD